MAEEISSTQTLDIVREVVKIIVPLVGRRHDDLPEWIPVRTAIERVSSHPTRDAFHKWVTKWNNSDAGAKARVKVRDGYVHTQSLRDALLAESLHHTPGAALDEALVNRELAPRRGRRAA